MSGLFSTNKRVSEHSNVYSALLIAGPLKVKIHKIKYKLQKIDEIIESNQRGVTVCFFLIKIKNVC